jgi:hypothetical protein
MPVSANTQQRALQGSAFRPVVLKNSSLRAMTKSMIETISEAIRDPKHPFRKADNQPKKAQKNRYERRKIKEYLHLADWETDAI